MAIHLNKDNHYVSISFIVKKKKKRCQNMMDIITSTVIFSLQKCDQVAESCYLDIHTLD